MNAGSVMGVVLAVLGISVGITATVSAGIGADSRQDARATLDQRLTDRASGLELAIDYVNPADSEAKPPAVRKVVTLLPRGARYDTSVPAACKASDVELMSSGAAACPPKSKVGAGVLTVDTGVPGPARIVTADVEFLNNTAEQILLATVRGTEARTVTRASVHGRRNAVDTPFLPGAPPDGGALDTVDVKLDKVASGQTGQRQGYITTPPRCSRSRRWVSKVIFTYSDQVTQTVRSPSRCEHRGPA